MSTCTRVYARSIYEKDMELTGSDQFKRVQGYLWKPNTILYLQRELELADYYIVASEFAKRSLLECGIDDKRIFKVPYGVDQDNFKYTPQVFDERKEKPLEMIFVGQVDYRKGIIHLLNALKDFEEKTINLKLVGEIDKKSEIYQIAQHMKNVSFTGFVTKDKLSDLYNASDVFIFPTLCEGFGLVVLEAMSCGVPVICSANAGGNDVIIEGENGFEIPASNVEVIKEKIQWCLDNREKLFSMRENAMNTAAFYTWERYYDGIAGVFDQIGKMN
jgi:glycosyltransferase involved in cell wall biosynthesis